MKVARANVLVLDDVAIAEMISMAKVIELVREAFAADANGEVSTMPVVGHTLPNHDGARYGIKSSHLRMRGRSGEVLGLKTGGYWPSNTNRKLPTHYAVILLTDPETGQPVALMAANVITSLRTAAGGAVAAQYLARADASRVAVIGAGEQAHVQLEALCEVRPVKEVHVWARRREAAQSYVDHCSAKGLTATATASAQEAVASADIILTTTPSRTPVVMSHWVKAGTHITAVGSDSPGKQELEVALLARAKVVVDKISQSTTIGEMQHALGLGGLGPTHIYAELGELCVGRKAGRTSEEEITVFDSSGVSFQDMVVAGHLLNLAKANQRGTIVTL